MKCSLCLRRILLLRAVSLLIPREPTFPRKGEGPSLERQSELGGGRRGICSVEISADFANRLTFSKSKHRLVIWIAGREQMRPKPGNCQAASINVHFRHIVGALPGQSKATTSVSVQE